MKKKATLKTPKKETRAGTIGATMWVPTKEELAELRRLRIAFDKWVEDKRKARQAWLDEPLPLDHKAKAGAVG